MKCREIKDIISTETAHWFLLVYISDHLSGARNGLFLFVGILEYLK